MTGHDHVVPLEPRKRVGDTVMPPTKQSAAIRQSITLKGSTDLVIEFFKYAVNTWVAFTISLRLNGFLSVA